MKSWDYTARGIVWKLLPCEGRRIVGEERDPDGKTLTLFCVSLDDGSPRWTIPSPGAGWWSGIETVHRGIVLLHDYPSPGMPDHRAIIAIDAADGRILWQNRDLAFAYASGGSVVGSRDLFDRRVFHELDLLTGAAGRELTGDEAAALRDDAGQGWGPGVQIPDPCADVPGTVRAVFPGGTELFPGEMLMHHDTHITNVYESRPEAPRGRALREHIVALDAATGAVLRRDIVCDGLAAVAGTSFFRFEDRIVYVRERRVLSSFAIPPGAAA